MTAFLRLLLALVAALCAAACATSAQPPGTRPLTVLISIDGFRTDYLDRGVTPTLSRLAAEGVRGTMRPSFPTKTFPNHYTLVTGLRPDRHGIVENNMRDPAMPGVTFKMSNKAAVADGRWWREGTPIWVTAEKAGIRSATMFWPGSEAEIHGVRPSHWKPFDQSLGAEARVDQVLAWVDLPPGRRPGLVTLYFDEVDTEGHHHGPDSAEVDAAAARTDAAIGRLVAGLKARGVAVNLVIGADHGMAALSPERRIFAEDLFTTEDATTLTLGALATVYPNPGRDAAVDRALIRPHAHMRCWRRGAFPARFHYGANPRVAPITCLPETGWEITTRTWVATNKTPEKGAHGFDPFSEEMAAVFVAHGPAFRPGSRPPVFDNVDVYPLLARLAGVKPEPNDGDLDELRAVLR